MSFGTIQAFAAIGDWTISNNQVAWTYLGAATGNDRQVAGSGDYNGGGTSDILWYNTSTTTSGWWEMASNTRPGVA